MIALKFPIAHFLVYCFWFSIIKAYTLASITGSDPTISSPSPSTTISSEAHADRLRMLLGEIAAGRKNAFEDLYTECSLPLYRVLLRILKQDAVSQEALQETFLKIWTNAGQYHPAKASPMVWMTRIAKNQAIDQLRHRRIRVDLELDNSEEILSRVQESGTYALSDEIDRAEPLLECLDRLEEKPKLCVIRAYCEGYSHEELSSLTGSPIGTVKSWIRRSLDSLKRCLDEFN